ncbi:MAG TPA: transposase [Phycisphaerae bacterium]|nr:transposase [Phycisphaerae bacterium]
MARPLRVEFDRAVYHVMARGNERRAIVRDDRDRKRWLDTLGRVAERYGWRVSAFALMDNHFHLFLQTPQPNLSAGMHDLNGSYAGYFNARHRRVGHLLQGRFKSLLVEDRGYWRQVSRYVHLNPVRARLAARPEDWRWSSYPGYHRPARRLAWADYGPVLAEFGGDGPDGRRAYRAYVEDALGRRLDNPLSAAVHGLVLGSDAFVERVRAMVAGQAEDPETPTLGRLRRGAGMAEVIAAVVGRLGGQPERWRAGRRCDDPSRAVAAYVARQASTLAGRDIAEALGYRNVSSVSVACRRVEAALSAGRLGKALREILADLATNH